jgi:hypothetical protein
MKVEDNNIIYMHEQNGMSSLKRLVLYCQYCIMLRHYATNRNVVGLIPDEVIFLIYLILPAALGPGIYSASNRNDYKKHTSNNVPGSKVRRVCRADNLTTICEPIV